MEKRMYKINIKMTNEVVNYIHQMEMEELNGNMKLYIDTVYNGMYNDYSKISDFFSFSFGNCFDGIEASLCIPMIYKDLDGFQDDMYWFLCDKYNFDLFNWGMKYGFTFEQSSILFDICHELGHMKQSIYEVNRYGFYKTLEMEEKDRYNLNFVKDEEELFVAYRLLKTESYADKTSVELLIKHGDYLAQMVNRGLLTEVDSRLFNEVDSIILG